ncbi:unnamed protein product [Caenorhabditis bovis]|uniref:Uncharacterized protein n=1 Tax=Caenorhabditis bovis TaxID=2654633 RepID=A0A8S1ETN0_9PELO|nr:unnamed protein product [Caenorhabditis bovis]
MEPLFEPITLDTITRTPLSYRNRITFECCVHVSCVIINFVFCLFFIARPNLFNSFKPTICFVTFGTFFLSLPLSALQLYLVLKLWLDQEPLYTVTTCTFVKCVTSCTTSCSQVLPLPVSIYRYLVVVRNRKMPTRFVVVIHAAICTIFLLIALLNFPLGSFELNDQCEILRFSKTMEAIRISLTLGLNILAVFINFTIYMFVTRYDRINIDVHRRRVQLTVSMLVQSTIPILVSIPLLIGSFHFYFGFSLPSHFTSHFYATTFVSPFFTPFSSMLSLQSLRSEMFDALSSSFCCTGTRKISSLLILKTNRGTNHQTFDYCVS